MNGLKVVLTVFIYINIRQVHAHECVLYVLFVCNGSNSNQIQIKGVSLTKYQST